MRAKVFIKKAYFLDRNPFPEDAIVSWGSSDDRSNGSLFSEEVCPDRYEEAVTKFIVNPVDAGSKFHFLWSLGDTVEARGFGKTATLHYIARMVNKDLGYTVLRSHGFDELEAKATPILVAMATFDTHRVTTLAAISLEHVKYLLKPDGWGDSPLNRVRQRMVSVICREANTDQKKDTKDDPLLINAIANRIRQMDLSISGKTLGAADRKFVQYFANGDLQQLLQYANEALAKDGYDLLHTTFVIARAAEIQRVFLLIDQVEDFANADIPRKRRQMEVERFRDLAIETQPFGEMASYVLTMHPEAARSIEEFWSLARLPRIDHMSRQTERVTVVLRRLEKREEATNLILPYLKRFRAGTPPDEVFPFSSDAIEVLRELSGGRPGEILKKANQLIAAGATEQWARITERELRQYFEEDKPQAERPRFRRVGAID